MVMPGVIALIVGLALAAFFFMLLGRRGPWDGFLWFFLVVFLGAWAVGSWAAPVGPVWMGVSWVPIFVAAVSIGLLLAAISAPRPGITAVEPGAETETEAAATLGGFFWLLLILLAAVIIAGNL